MLTFNLEGEFRMAQKPDPAPLGGKSAYTKRYIGTTEIAAYSLAQGGRDFTVKGYMSYFMLNVFQLDPGIMGLILFLEGFWDVINDLVLGAVVDRTRTRFGKFRPWLLACVGPFALANVTFWLSPLFLSDFSSRSWEKILTYTVIYTAMETLETLVQCSYGGLLATASPNPEDRTTLIASGRFISSLFSNLPQQICGLLIDLSTRNIIGASLGTVFITMGVGTTLIGNGMVAFYAIRSRERIVQSIEKPNIMEGFKNVFANKPLLLLMLSDFLAAFGNVGGPFENLYYIDVLGVASAKVIVGIPGSPVSYCSYALVPWFRRHFNNKQIWFICNLVPDFLWIMVFLLGYNFCDNWKVMIPLIMLQETLANFLYATRKVVPEEMKQEAIDYAEWKTGKRTEAMTGAAQGLASKAVNTLQGAISTAVVSLVGYTAGAGTNQTMRTKHAIFAMWSVAPIVLGALGLVPMLFYDLIGEKRNKMYEELIARRREIAKTASDLTLEDSDNFAQAASSDQNAEQ